MGLFIGASLLTILEILDYLCEVGLSLASEARDEARIANAGSKQRATSPLSLLGHPRQSPAVLLEAEQEALPKAF